MQAVAKRDAQYIDVNGKVRYARKGQVVNAKTYDLKYFRMLDVYDIDFDNASQELFDKATWKLMDLKKHAEENYGYKIKAKSKVDAVKEFLYARENYVQ